MLRPMLVGFRILRYDWTNVAEPDRREGCLVCRRGARSEGEKGVGLRAKVTVVDVAGSFASITKLKDVAMPELAHDIVG